MSESLKGNEESAKHQMCMEQDHEDGLASATSGGILDRAIEAEDKKHRDLLRLEHVKGYLELSAKTKTYFTTAVALWDADFFVKVDVDVHVNIGSALISQMIHH